MTPHLPRKTGRKCAPTVNWPFRGPCGGHCGALPGPATFRSSLQLMSLRSPCRFPFAVVTRCSHLWSVVNVPAYSCAHNTTDQMTRWPDDRTIGVTRTRLLLFVWSTAIPCYYWHSPVASCFISQSWPYDSTDWHSPVNSCLITQLFTH